MNFRKASIFQRDTEKPEVQNDSGGMLAVWGSPGSGKTVTAVKIAKALSAKKKNVILLLCDMSAPMLPCICHADALESKGSLASVLAAARISENLIKHNLVTFKRNSCLAVLGLLERQNEYSTPPFTQKQVVELLDGLRQIAPYVIVDCGSYIANDILSAVALMEADSILRLANCDPKSVNYFASQLSLLDGPEWDMDKQYKVASNVKPYQAADHIGKVLGDTTFVLPYSQELDKKEDYEARQDLILTGRTLFGAPSAKGQELEEHYFGVIRPEVSAFMKELDEELWKLGVPAKTKHNEVAPCQHELAPIYDTTNVAIDHNLLTMEMMKKIAPKYGLVCLHIFKI